MTVFHGQNQRSLMKQARSRKIRRNTLMRQEKLNFFQISLRGGNAEIPGKADFFPGRGISGIPAHAGIRHKKEPHEYTEKEKYKQKQTVSG